VSHPLLREVTDYAEYPGRTAAIDSLQVRARVSGYLDKIAFQEGQEVREGEVLFEIDPRPYRAALNQAEAQVSLQKAAVQYQEDVYQRNRRLYSQQGVAQQEMQQAIEQLRSAEASLRAARAAVEQAKLNLDWTEVRSAVGGRIGRALVTRGNLVVADQTLLTTIVSLDPMYAFFDMDEPTVLRVQELIRTGQIIVAGIQGVPIDAAFVASVVGLHTSAAIEPLLPATLLLLGRTGPHWPVYLGLANETGFPHAGYVDFVNNQINAGTATLQIRGVFSNPLPPRGPRVLAPGMFVRIRVVTRPPHPAVLVIQDAIGMDQNLKYVYLVDEHNQVERRNVTLGPQHEGLQEITSGLQAADRVIVNGLQHVHQGMAVAPTLVPMPTPGELERPTGSS
jgi:multidrug efflux system membrane fusion protein